MSNPPTQPVVEVLERTGITHVLGIPDNTSGPLFLSLLDHASIRLVPVTREGEAFAVAAGLWLGGASPLVIIQNTGLLESGDAIRGTVTRMGAPVPVVVTGRGYAKMEAAGLGPQTPRTPELLTRPELDSVAFLTEPTLDAWGIPYRRCRPGDDVPLALTRLVDETTAGNHPRALLLTAPLA